MKLSYVILYVKDIEASIAFYKQAFDLGHKFTHEGGDYAEMDTGETTLAFCNHQLAESLFQDNYEQASLKNKVSVSQITLAANDIQQAYEKAMQAGAVSISSPEIKPWNFEVASVRDIDGHTVELAKNLNI